MKKIVIASIATLAIATSSFAGASAMCAGCHGKLGEKNTMVKESKPNTMSKADFIAAIAGYKAGTLNKYGKGNVMKSFSSRLSPAKLEEIATEWKLK